MAEPISVIPKIAWLHIKSRRLLGVRSKGRVLFYVPGGKPEAGESDNAALKREILEELGVQLIDSSIGRYGYFLAPADRQNGTAVGITAYTGDYSGTLNPSAEIAEQRFLSSSDGEDVVSPVTFVILQHLKAAHVID